MKLKLSEFKVLSTLVMRREFVQEYADAIDAAVLVTGGVRRDNTSDFGDLNIVVTGNRSEPAKQLLREECIEQLAELDRKIAAYGIEIEK